MKDSKNRAKIFLGIGALVAALFFIYNNSTHDKLQAELLGDEDLDAPSKMTAPPGTKEAMAEEKTLGLPGPDVSAAAHSPSLNEQLSKLSQEDKKSWASFEEIMVSKNDNDPRIDQNLRHLSEPMREIMMQKYSDLPQEKRNERGLIAFLIARDLKSPQDIEFLKEIYNERPCLSLENCAAASKDEDPHHSGMDHVSLNYPQMVALYQLDAQLTQRPELLNDPAFKTRVRNLLDLASRFDAPSVQKKAEELRAKF